MRMTILAACLVFLAVLNSCGNQNGAADAAKPEGPLPDIQDTVCLFYDFRAGDSLVYRGISRDSIVMDAVPLIKSRTETIVLVCDSLDNKGRFHLRQTILHLHSEERMGSESAVVENDGPYIGRTIWLVLDSLGQRHATALQDTTPGLAPGGAFQPGMLIALGESCKGIDESWELASVTDTLRENGYPAPLRRRSMLNRIMPRADTLGEQCLSIRYGLTGQGSALTPTRHQPMLLTSILTEYGTMQLAKRFMLPVHRFSTLEAKLTLKTPQGHEAKGRHYINSNYTLLALFRGGKRIYGQ